MARPKKVEENVEITENVVEETLEVTEQVTEPVEEKKEKKAEKKVEYLPTDYVEYYNNQGQLRTGQYGYIAPRGYVAIRKVN